MNSVSNSKEDINNQLQTTYDEITKYENNSKQFFTSEQLKEKLAQKHLLIEGQSEKKLEYQNDFISLCRLNELYKNFLIITILLTCLIIVKLF